MHLIAHGSYLRFAEIVAEPIYQHLIRNGLNPSFEVRSALRFNPYAHDGKERVLADPFWHLDKESERETFDRLLNRRSLSSIQSFFHSYYFKGMGWSKTQALEDVKKFDSFNDLLTATDASMLSDTDKSLQFHGSFSVYDSRHFKHYRVTMYADHTFCMRAEALELLAATYKRFREAFLEHRKLVEQSEEIRGHDWSWD